MRCAMFECIIKLNNLYFMYFLFFKSKTECHYCFITLQFVKYLFQFMTISHKTVTVVFRCMQFCYFPIQGPGFGFQPTFAFCHATGFTIQFAVKSNIEKENILQITVKYCCSYIKIPLKKYGE